MQKNTSKSGAWLDWLIGVLLASAALTAIVLWGDLRYAGNDDGVMLRPLMGFGGDVPPDFYQCLHPIIAYPLIWISMLMPATAWFSYMQLAMLWFAGALSVKCIVGGFRRRGYGAVSGMAASVIYLAVFWVVYSCHVTFTVTAAVLGAAAVLQTLSIDPKRQSDGQLVRSLLLALFAVVLAYGLRQIAALPILAFCGLALLYRFFADYRSEGKLVRPMKPLVTFAIIGVVLFGALVGGRELEIRLKGKQEYLNWQRASTSVIDYCNLNELPDELLAEIGWTRAEQRLINRWYFMDSNISTEAFERIYEYTRERDTRGLRERLSEAYATVASLGENEPSAWRSVYVILGLMGLCIISLCLRRKGTLWRLIALMLGAALTFALLIYLGYNGRLPWRAALIALLPLAALVAGLVPDCLPEAGGAGMGAVRRIVLVLSAACVLALAVSYAIPAAQSLRKPDQDEAIHTPFADLDEYASDNPEYLLIYDHTFASDSRMFPTTEYGTPDNILFWGGWPTHSDDYNNKLRAYGIDPDNADVTLFLNENVRLVRGTIENDPDELYDYLCEKSGQDVSIWLDANYGGVYSLEFYVEE